MAGKKRQPGGAVRSPLAGRILQQRGRGEAEVSLERLEADLADVSRYDLVASLKELEKAGKGQFLVGRKGKKSRFVWKDKAERGEKPERGDKAERGAASAASPAAPATSPASAPAASEEISRSEAAEEDPTRPQKGLARKVLVPVGRRIERPRLSAHDPGEPVARLSGRGRSLQHSFHLRPGLQVSIELPEDITATEIDRFCTFLKAIPFAGSGRL
jgi:hypothetical protein